MSLTLRNTKGSSLTFTEMDSNLTYLEGLGFSGVTTVPPLSQVLTSGNTTSGNNIVLSTGDKINAASGGGQLDLRYGADNEVMLSNDSGDYSDEFLYLSEGYIELASYASNSNMYVNSGKFLSLNGVGSNNFLASFSDTVSNIVKIGAGATTFDSIAAGGTLENSVVLGGTGQVVNASNTVYVSDLALQEGKKIFGVGAENYVRIEHPVVISRAIPSGSTDTSGVVGELRFNDNFSYIKTSNGWKRHINEVFGFITTTDATLTTILTIPLPTGVSSVEANIKGFFISSKGFSGKVIASYRRPLMGSSVKFGVDIKEINSEFDTADISLAVSGSDILVQVKGEASTSINWSANVTIN